jgi:hypothetical protein
MLLYNITIGVDKEIETEWLQWIKINHIPAVMKTGLFIQSGLFKVLHDQDEETVSYSIQYFAKDIKDVTSYLDSFAPKIMEAHRKRFANRHVAFQTLLEEA